MAFTIGVLGVGRMGSRIARALIAAGYRVLVFDPAPDRLAGFLSAPSATQVAAESDVLLTVLPGVPEFSLMAEDVLDALRPGSLWLDLTSNDPRVVERLAERAVGREVAVVGAPMGGGVAAAGAASLTFSVGGTDDAVARARPVLDVLGSIDHIGESVGSGYTAKLLGNLLWFGQVVAVTEALLLGQSLGIPPARLHSTLAAGPAQSAFIDEYLDRLLDGDYLESFGIDRCVEELDILASLAQGEGVPFELSMTVTRLHREALERFGAIDGELLAVRLLEERAGRQLRR